MSMITDSGRVIADGDVRAIGVFTTCGHPLYRAETIPWRPIFGTRGEAMDATLAYFNSKERKKDMKGDGMNISRPAVHPWQKQHYSHVEDKDMMASRKPRNIFQIISDGLNDLMHDSFDRALVDGVPEQEQVSEDREISDRIDSLVDDVQSIKNEVEDILESDVSDDVVLVLNSASGYASLLVGALLGAARKVVSE